MSQPPRRVMISEALEMRRLYEDEGLSIRQIGGRLSRSLCVVHRHLLGLGVTLRPAHVTVPLTAEKVQEAADMYEAGLSCLAIAALTGITERGVRHRLQVGGVRRRSAGKRSPGYHPGRDVRVPVAALVPVIAARIRGAEHEGFAVRALGLDQRTWFAWKTGERRKANLSTVDAVLRSLGVNPWDVWTPDDPAFELVARLWGFEAISA